MSGERWFVGQRACCPSLKTGACIPRTHLKCQWVWQPTLPPHRKLETEASEPGWQALRSSERDSASKNKVESRWSLSVNCGLYHIWTHVYTPIHFNIHASKLVLIGLFCNLLFAVSRCMCTGSIHLPLLSSASGCVNIVFRFFNVAFTSLCGWKDESLSVKVF